mgnify:CR=1 FL=1
MTARRHPFFTSARGRLLSFNLLMVVVTLLVSGVAVFGFHHASQLQEQVQRQTLNDMRGSMDLARDTANVATAAVRLSQVAEVGFAPAVARGGAGFDGRPAVILSVQKQPGADSVALTQAVEQAMATLNKALPQGIETPQFLFKQADFIERSVGNVQEALRDGAILVAVVLFLFLLNVRTTVISLSRSALATLELSMRSASSPSSQSSVSSLAGKIGRASCRERVSSPV